MRESDDPLQSRLNIRRVHRATSAFLFLHLRKTCAFLRQDGIQFFGVSQAPLQGEPFHAISDWNFPAVLFQTVEDESSGYLHIHPVFDIVIGTTARRAITFK